MNASYRHTMRLLVPALTIGVAGLLFASSVHAAGTTAVQTGTTVAQGVTSCAKGVLVSGDCVNSLTFPQYLTALLKEGMPLVLFLAVLAIAASGVQYMFGGLSPDNTKKAKQRIIGIVIGGLLFVSINLILQQLAGGITLAPAPPKQVPGIGDPIVP